MLILLISAFRVAKIIGVNHCTWPEALKVLLGSAKIVLQ
jgi:hypothetical protein